MRWPRTTITLPQGDAAGADAPLVISASRRTDIPAFHLDWFFRRLDEGWLATRNPFNGARGYVALRQARFVVFWSKNPRPLLDRLGELDRRRLGHYIQFTLNDYEREGWEGGVPPLAQRVDTFRRLADRLGPHRVVWRFDPLLLTADITPDLLLERVAAVARKLTGYTKRLVFSFADIAPYRTVKANLARRGVGYREWTPAQADAFARGLAAANRAWGFELAACAEPFDMSRHGIAPSRCVDAELMARVSPHDEVLMRFIGAQFVDPGTDLFPDTLAKSPSATRVADLGGGRRVVFGKQPRDAGQRPHCHCAPSKDIGAYSTCPHRCAYCYANVSMAKVDEAERQAAAGGWSAGPGLAER